MEVNRMEEYIVIVARTLILYFLIVLIFRIMGKREIGELSILDLVVFIMLAEIAVMAIEKPKDPLAHSLIPMVVMVVLQLLFAMISLRSKSFREMIDGKPAVIIHNGKIDEVVMKKQRYNFDDLLLQLREKDVFNVADVEFAILETSGKLSVLKKQGSADTYALPIILDGEIQTEHLQQLGKSPFWLRGEMKKRGYPAIRDIAFCSYDKGEFYIDEK